MTDGQLLLAALAAFALLECLRWVPTRAWIFQGSGPGSWRAARPWKLFRTRGGAVTLLQPVPPLEPHLVTAAWPCAPHDDGLAVWDDDSGAVRHVPWDRLSVHAEGSVLHLTAEARTRCPNAAVAATWARRVRAWVKQSPSQRTEDFLQHAGTMLDAERITAAASTLEQQTRWLRRVGSWIFWLAFAGLPPLYWRFADRWPTFAGAGLLFALLLAQAMLLWRTMRREGKLGMDDFMQLVGVALFPPSAMRAADRLCSVKAPEAHPLAALKAWSDEATFTAAAATMWREARWPIGDASRRPWNGPEVQALASWFETNGIASSPWDAPPAAQDGCSRWCPRCLVQYAAPATQCADCGGMPLADLPAQHSLSEGVPH